MKKITLFFVFAILVTFTSYAQTLNQNASWPNTNWALTGTYNTDPLALEADPTLTANFAFDDDDAGAASDDDIAAESPVIDLSAAHTAGETWLTVTADYTYNDLADTLTLEYWDADSASWLSWQQFVASADQPTDNFCGGTRDSFTSNVLNIAAFTAAQQSGFRYRISFLDDGGAGGAAFEWGFCFDAPTITSATPPSCPDPSALGASNIDGFSADFGWTESGTAALWNIELVDITGGGVATGTATATGVANPFNQTGLVPSNNYEFYVQADCGVDGTSAWVGPFAFATTVACQAPNTLTATNILTTTADLGWTAGGSETLWDVEIVDITAAGTPTGTPTASGVANPYGASGLTANNAYEFYVRTDCAANGTSNWVGPFMFDTACNTFTAPYSEDFENGGAVPACWTLGGDEDWLFNTAGPNHVGNGGTLSGSTASGSYYAVVDDSTPDAANAELTSPFIDVSGLTTPALIFYEISDNEGLGGNATLTASVWDGAAWNTVGTYNTNTVAGWEQKVIDLSGLTFTGDAQVRFSIADSGSFYDDIAIDDVQVVELPACPDPSVLTAANITNNSADLGWTEVGSAMLWNVELVDITGGGAVTGTATATGVANPYMATGLTQNNDYAFYVQADCGGGTTSNWVGPFAFTTLETCPAPTALNATNIMETAADLGWTQTGTATLWNVELVDITAGGAATGTATATGVMNPYMATGLVGDNNYEFYVQADCGVDGTSAWAGPFAFATAYVAVAPDCTNGTFLDSGGFSGDYSDGETTTYTITPDVAGDVVSVNFSAFSTENNGAAACYDGLTIHNGPDATAATIDPPGGGTIWCWDRDDTPAVGTGDLQGMTITSTDPSGALTFVFTSDGSVQREGWEATVTCTTLTTEDFDNGLAFSYYPNPVKGTLFLQAQNDIQNVSVYNMLGQEVLSNTPNNFEENLDMSTLQAGAYFVKVTIGNVAETIRIIKTN